MFRTSRAAKQRTLKDAISYVGVGLHTGRKVSMILRPAPENTGIRFVRKDMAGAQGEIEALWHNVVDTRLCTVIGNGFGTSLGTVEHLMAALRGCGVDNALVEVDGPEVPIMDGSAEPFVALIERVGTVAQSVPRRVIWLHRPVEVRIDDKFAMLSPGEVSRFTVEIRFPHPAIGTQRRSVELGSRTFVRDLAAARTFGFAEEIDELRRNGLARGGSVRNAIVVDGDQVANPEGLRFADEFVRHKLLDAVGDLYLAGAPILGHYRAYKPGHMLNYGLLKKLLSDDTAWSYLTLDEVQDVVARQRVAERMSRSASAGTRLAAFGGGWPGLREAGRLLKRYASIQDSDETGVQGYGQVSSRN